MKMRRQIKIFAMVMIIVTNLTFFSGCQGSEEGNKTEYTFATWAAGEELKEFKEIIDRVNTQANGAYTIKVLSVPSDYYVKLSTFIAGKKTPDFFWLTQELISKYANLGAIADLTEQFTESESIAPESFYPGVLKSAQYNERYYGIPWIANPLIVYYNQDLFEEAGVAFPDPLGGWTWEEFIDIAKELTVEKTDTLGNQYQQYGYIVDGWPNIETFLWAGGGDIIAENGLDVLLDSPESMKGLDLLNEILVSNISPAYSKVSSLGSNNVWFEKQRAAIFMGGIQDNFEEKISKLPESEQFNIGYAPMPVCADGKSYSFDWTASTVMSSKLQDDDVAYEILEAITKEFFEWKVAPPIIGNEDQVVEIDPFKAAALPTIKVCLENTRSANYVPEWNEINDMLWLRLYNNMLSDPKNFDYAKEAKKIASESRERISERK